MERGISATGGKETVMKPVTEAIPIRTLMGYSARQAHVILAHPLPPQCYEKIDYSDYTDIDAVARRIVFDKLFGPAGVGWTIASAGSVTEPFTKKTKSGDKIWGRTTISEFSLRVRWVVGDVPVWGEAITVPVCWEQNEIKYVPKGAATAGFGSAASFLGFQSLVYLGRLDHNNAANMYETLGPHPFHDDLLWGMARRLEAEPEDEKPPEPKDETPKADDGTPQRYIPPKEMPSISLVDALGTAVGSTTITAMWEIDPMLVRGLIGNENKAISDAALVAFRRQHWAWGNEEGVLKRFEKIGVSRDKALARFDEIMAEGDPGYSREPDPTQAVVVSFLDTPQSRQEMLAYVSRAEKTLKERQKAQG
jgi:hypothetical protein